MTEKDKPSGYNLGDAPDGNQWPGIDSRYRLIVVAALRAKQLQRGATPRLEPDPRRSRNTYISLEEVKRGLVPFTNDFRESGGEDPSSLT
ncbi:MAG TPA: DNA-directed RNA polymerase subunit omega [Pyrinomonadaceae bacterium]|nr:DNA-directed RNA polymerase subunit omega [Pyrinomonadaceae bacterium]